VKVRSQQAINNKQSKAFTIVELLVVIVVIGILAAISIVSYTGIQNRARATVAQNDLRQAATQLELHNVTTGSYPQNLSDTDENRGVPASNGTTYQYRYNADGTYCLTATNGAQTYSIESTNPTPKQGACAGHGAGGNPAITNLVINPRPSTSYWFASSTSAGQVTFPTVNGTTVARSTKVGTAAYALYSNRTSSVSTAQTGDTYTALFTIRSSVNTTITFQVGYGSGTAVISSLNRSISLTANTPQTIRHTFTIPSGYDGQPIFNKFLWSSASPDQWFEVSNVMWVEGTYNGNYADGDSAGWIWNGSTNGSTSTGPAL